MQLSLAVVHFLTRYHCALIRPVIYYIYTQYGIELPVIYRTMNR